MTSEEQEALSHRHLGMWIVPLKSGKLAAFAHPQTSLIGIVDTVLEAMELVRTECEKLLKDLPNVARPINTDIDLDLSSLDL